MGCGASVTAVGEPAALPTGSSVMAQFEVEMETEMRAAFEKLDEDKSGSLSLDEVRDLVQKLEPDLYPTAKKAAPVAKKLFKECDTNGSGCLEYEEFAEYWEREGHKKSNGRWGAAKKEAAAADKARKGRDLFLKLPPPFDTKIDVALANGAKGAKAMAWLFSGGQVLDYATWKGARTRVLAGPVPAAEHPIFGELPPPFDGKVDAVLSNGLGGSCQADWFFCDGLVLEYTSAEMKGPRSSRLRSAPVLTTSHAVWGELPPPFDRNIDAALTNGLDGEYRTDWLFSEGKVLDYTPLKYIKKRVKETYPIPNPCKVRDHPIFGDLPVPFLTTGPALTTGVDAAISNGVDGKHRVDWLFSGRRVLNFSTWTYGEPGTRVKSHVARDEHVPEDCGEDCADGAEATGPDAGADEAEDEVREASAPQEGGADAGLPGTVPEP